MICGACKASVPAGSTSCPSCKRKFAVKPKPAAPAPAPKPAPAEDDLLGPEPPPRPAAPRPAPSQSVVRGRRPTGHRAGMLRSSGRGAQLTAGGLISLLVVGGLLSLRVCRVARTITGQTVMNETITVPTDDAYAGVIEVEGSHTYTFEVTAIDGPLQMSFGRMTGKDQPTPADAMGLMASAKAVPMGQTQKMTGSVSTGRYVWILINDEQRPVRAKVNFHGR